MYWMSPYIGSAINTAVSFVLLFLSIIMVRRAALRQATGQLFSLRKRKAIKKEIKAGVNKRDSTVISVIGPPILWKELILPFRKHSRILRTIGVIIFLVLLFYSYWFFIKEGGIQREDVNVFYVLIFMGLGSLFTIVLSATSITSEKESMALPLLLISTLKDSQIIIGKLYGILSRVLPVWSLLLIHFFYFSMNDIIHPSSVSLIVILVIWMMFFLSSSGIYFSSFFRHTTTAVIMNFVFAGIIWGLIPVMLAIFSELMHDHDFIEVFMTTNPFIQVVVIMISTVGIKIYQTNRPLMFDWPMGNRSYNTTLMIFVVSFCVYMAISLIFLWRAKKRIRRKIF